MDNREISYIRFHQELFVPNVPNVGNVLPPVSKTFKDLKVMTSPWGAVVRIEGHEILVPWANVILAKLASQPKDKA